MSPRFGSYKIEKKVGELRRSQLITTYGPGALADFPKLSGIVMGLDFWKMASLSKDSTIHERNLEQLLGKDHFIQPETTENNDELNKKFGLPVQRFPNIYYCPNCNALDAQKKIGGNTGNSKSKNVRFLSCNKCGRQVKLIPSRFIVSCINGHIDDFPYAWWVHRGKGKCEKPRLSLKYLGRTGGLDSILVVCETCGAKSSMQGAMGENALKGFTCKKRMPWLGENYKEPDECLAQPRTLQRSANNVYYPVNQSALTIPPWSNIAQAAINRYYEALEEIFDEEDIAVLNKRLEKFYEKKEIQNHYGCDKEYFYKEAHKRFNDTDQEISVKSIILDEYKAFSLSDIDDPYFKTTKEPVPSNYKKLIKSVKLVKRLREVQVILGFRRIFSDYAAGVDGVYERSFAPISKGPMSWLPAVELFGEGIFIVFDEDVLKAWEKRNAGRYIDMFNKLGELPIGKEMFSPRYVLLHTFSHLLIRELSFQCGYSSSALKEKIYSTYLDVGEPMSGILIYTAATDCDGSLGGLVRRGHQKYMEETINGILTHSSWCSNDPICIDSKSQGYRSLNYAACHACTLLPETSCESMNCLLDRAAITGTPDNKEIALFRDFL